MIGIVAAVLVLGAWAGLFALAEESSSISRAPGNDPDSTELFRLIYVGRLVLLLSAGVAASFAVSWWTRGAIGAVGAILAAGGFLYMVADALPRAVAALAPEVSDAAAVLAARTVGPFRWLAPLVDGAERVVTAVLPRETAVDERESAAQRDMLLGLFSLSETTVEEIMTPRLDVDALESTADWNAVIEYVRRSDHARIPVYTDTRDRIDGILYAKDLVAAVAGDMDRPARWQDLIRPAQFVPESKSLSAQLRDFQRGPGHLAVVVDEYGGTSGIVTLEDTLEEIVGEIHDEYDPDERPAIEWEGDDKLWVDGAVTLDELEALLGITIESEDVTTVGGFVYDELGRVPSPGEEFRYRGFKVIVEQVVRRRVRRVYFERTAPGEDPPEPAGEVTG